jgi:hypothetical protein
MSAGYPVDSFDEEAANSWDLWVLDNGLPDLPETVQKGESVPIARWVGPRFGAVLRVEWCWAAEPPPDWTDRLESVVEVFMRTPDGWKPSSGWGGSGWYEPPLQRLSILDPQDAYIGNLHSSGDHDWNCAARFGVVGTDVVATELVSDEGKVRLPVESAIGAVIIAFDATRPATIRLIAADGSIVTTTNYQPPSGRSRGP